MTSADRRWSRIRHGAKLFGWQVSLLDGRLACCHERGAQLVWPMVRSDAHEQVLLQLFRLPIPRSVEDEQARDERLRRRAEIQDFHQRRVAGR